MPFQLQGFSGVVPEVDATLRALRVNIRPTEVLTWNTVAAKTGSLTGLAAGNNIFSFRNSGTNLFLVRRIGIGFVTTTAFTTAQAMDFSLFVARAFTISDSGGTQIALSGNTSKHRTSMPAVTASDLRVSSTAALTAGTRTVDATALTVIGFWVPSAGNSLPYSYNNMFSRDTGDYPLVLAANEGLVIQNTTAMGAAGVGIAYIDIGFAEAAAY